MTGKNGDNDNLEQLVGYKEDPKIVEIIDKVALNKGYGKRGRSAYVRNLVRQELASMSYLSPDIKKALGVLEPITSTD